MTIPKHDERTVYGTDPDPGEPTVENVPLAGNGESDGETDENQDPPAGGGAE